MAIRKITNKPMRRGKVCFFEDEPPVEATVYLNEYEVCRLNASSVENVQDLSEIAAVVFIQNSEKPAKIERYLSHYANTLLWHDCRVFAIPVRSDPNIVSGRKKIAKAIKHNHIPSFGLKEHERGSLPDKLEYDKDLTPVVHVVDNPSTPWASVVRFLHAYPPGNPPNLDLDIDPIGDDREIIRLTSEEKVLVQRAFHDCSKVKLKSQQEGRSGVYTYQASAVRSMTGDNIYTGDTQPYQYFVKIGEREQIAKEFLAYRDIVLEHIPFHLGPRLRLDRCALGTGKGIIVCDYVGDSENLRDCARDGRAVPVIASLFNTTLRAWLDGSSLSVRLLKDYLRDRMPEEIPEQRKALIEEIEPIVCPAELSRLLELKGTTSPLIGTIHGDLHSLNVLVRGTDAILIDFEKVESNKPLLLDFASLEAGLLIDGFINECRSRRALLESIKPYYEIDSLVHHKQVKYDPSDETAWFLDCIRQIRMHAREIEQEEREYALTLAVELAKKACKDFPDSQSKSTESGLTVDDVRSLAYILCQRILTAA